MYKIKIISYKMRALVFKRCISALPEDECPYIPASYLKERRPKKYSQLTAQIPQSTMTRYASGSSISKNLDKSAKSNDDCQEKRDIGQEIIIEKMVETNTLPMRFAENIIFHMSGGKANTKQVK